MKNCILNVGGMSCAHCERAVKNDLTELEGISDVSVSLENGTVSVTYNEETISEDTIKATIIETGYEIL